MAQNTGSPESALRLTDGVLHYEANPGDLVWDSAFVCRVLMDVAGLFEAGNNVRFTGPQSCFDALDTTTAASFVLPWTT